MNIFFNLFRKETMKRKIETRFIIMRRINERYYYEILFLFIRSWNEHNFILIFPS